MPITVEEQKALDKLHQDVTQYYANAFWLCRDFLRADEKHLHNCGHKTVEGAIVSTVKNTLADVDKLHKAHVKRFPDK